MPPSKEPPPCGFGSDDGARVAGAAGADDIGVDHDEDILKLNDKVVKVLGVARVCISLSEAVCIRLPEAARGRRRGVSVGETRSGQS